MMIFNSIVSYVDPCSSNGTKSLPFIYFSNSSDQKLYQRHNIRIRLGPQKMVKGPRFSFPAESSKNAFQIKKMNNSQPKIICFPL